MNLYRVNRQGHFKMSPKELTAKHTAASGNGNFSSKDSLKSPRLIDETKEKQQGLRAPSCSPGGTSKARAERTQQRTRAEAAHLTADVATSNLISSYSQ